MIPAFLWVAYCSGAAFLALGVYSVRKEFEEARGLEKIVACARACFAAPLVIFGSQHLAMGRAVMVLVPAWMPGHLFWTYLVGCALFAAALSILLKRQIWLSATLLGIMFVLFEATLHIPRIVAAPRDRFTWVIALRDLSFAAGAFALAAMQTEAWRAI